MQGVGGATVTTSEPLGPIQPSQRILSLDVLRGFALLGIFMVNMQVFAMPLTRFMIPTDLAESGTADVVAWWIVKAFFEYKFISMFSLLFGAGLIMQMTRAAERGRPFVSLYLRRLFVLALIGLVHGFLLWYGDILFIYSIVGTILLLCRNFRPKTMLIIAASITAFFTLLNVAFLVLTVVLGGGMTMGPPAAATEEASLVEPAPAEVEPAQIIEADPEQVDDVEAAPDEPGEVASAADDVVELSWADRNPEVVRWLPWLPALIEAQFNPMSEEWAEAETIAYRDGPFLMAQGFRTVSFSMAIIMSLFSYGWHSLAMFLIGAALMKLRFFTTAPAIWRRRLAVWGLSIGVPMEIAQATLMLVTARTDDQQLAGVAATAAGGIHELGSVIMCLGLVGGIAVLVERGRFARVFAAFQNVGRLALSNYLLQTVVSTAIMYWWGMRFFGSVGRAEQLGLVVVIYAGQVVLSYLWLRVFRIGPMEWLWRSLTYLRLQPLLRRDST